MSKLYLNENGNIVPTLCDELTTYRRARKVLHLPTTRSPANVFILAQQHEGIEKPLRLSVNGVELRSIQPASQHGYCWYQVQVIPHHLKTGANTFEFWTDATAMNAWSLAIEPGHANPESFISDNGGVQWRNNKMGYLNVLRGEYVVRVRLIEGEDPLPPSAVCEELSNPRLEDLRRIVPGEARDSRPLLDRVRALSSWLSTSWEHTDAVKAVQYTPWDAETILSWGKSGMGHHGQRPIVMCVHYGVAFVTLCHAVGIQSRAVALAGTVNGDDGHFVAEVWFPEYEKWVMVDPNLDAMMWKDGVPLSVMQIQKLDADLRNCIRWGPGLDFQSRNAALPMFIERNYSKGQCFKHSGVWLRTDFLSHPEHAPSAHGSTAYCETEFVWAKEDLASGFGMFPYFASPDYFAAPPLTGR